MQQRALPRRQAVQLQVAERLLPLGGPGRCGCVRGLFSFPGEPIGLPGSALCLELGLHALKPVHPPPGRDQTTSASPHRALSLQHTCRCAFSALSFPMHATAPSLGQHAARNSLCAQTLPSFVRTGLHHTAHNQTNTIRHVDNRSAGLDWTHQMPQGRALLSSASRERSAILAQPALRRRRSSWQLIAVQCELLPCVLYMQGYTSALRCRVVVVVGVKSWAAERLQSSP